MGRGRQSEVDLTSEDPDTIYSQSSYPVSLTNQSLSATGVAEAAACSAFEEEPALCPPYVSLVAPSGDNSWTYPICRVPQVCFHK